MMTELKFVDFDICHILTQIPFDNDTELYDTVRVCLGLRSSEVLSMGKP
jgi:hypothetical protein